MREHAVTPALTVSFQRYPYPPSGWLETLPRSRGALPLAVPAPDHLLLPCPSGEAFWIGLVATARGPSSRVGVVARLASGERVDLETGAPPATGTGAAPATAPGPAGGPLRPGFAVPPRFAVEGIARQDGGWWALALEAPGPGAPACAGLELAVWTGPAAGPAAGGGPRPLHDPTSPPDPAAPSGPADRPPPPPGAEAPTGHPSAVVRVELLEAAGFEAATGQRLPGPAGDDAAYGGWRLP
jgi:hypothetical protein